MFRKITEKYRLLFGKYDLERRDLKKIASCIYLKKEIQNAIRQNGDKIVERPVENLSTTRKIKRF